jgi:signal transduction histidine kinase
MGFRLRSIRQRIFLLILVPVLSLIGLYIFATSLTAGNAINLARANTLRNATGEPAGIFLSALDTERPLAMVYLSSPTGANLAVLEAQESKTNGAIATARSALTSSATQGNASAGEKAAINTLLTDAAGLPALRSQIASQIITRTRAFNEYNNIVTDGYRVLDETILQETSAPVVTQSLDLVRMGRSEEMLLREDALLVSDLAARSFPASDRQQFAELVGARRTLYNETLPDLSPQYRAYYLKDVNPKALAALTALENSAVSATSAASPPPVDPLAWQQSVGGVSVGFSTAGTQASALITTNANATARASDLRLFLAGGLGLLAVLLSIIVSVWIGRGLVRELAALRQSALELANDRLPSVVRRLAAGEDVDVHAEAPEIPVSRFDEIGQVRQAFASVQQTAVEAAVGQARLRRGISDIFRNLARRSQSLLHRQLTLLDAMERRAGEPDQLADLFRIDHLTTRMRRHAESLIILSGDAPARGWRNPVPLVDVLRAAVAEVEDYTRIKVSTNTQAALAGPAVGDVIHMIAELAENAAIFSPPNTPVLITGDIVGRGFAVEIEDRGLGLSEEKLAEINDRLANPPAFDLSGSDQLGLFVASQLARRHDIKISLRASPYGGTTAIVLIPVGLVVPEGAYENDPSAGTVDERAIQLTGRHAVREDDDSGSPVSSLFAPRGGDPAKNGRTGAESGLSFPESSLALPESGLALPEPRLTFPEEAGPLSYADEDSSLAYPEEPGPLSYADANGSLAYPEEAEDWSAARIPLTADPVSTDDLEDAELPRRIRQASLAPQLRDSSGRIDTSTDSDPADDARSPEEARATVSAIQQGWQRGRSLFDPSAKPAVTGTTPAGDDGMQQDDD